MNYYIMHVNKVDVEKLGCPERGFLVLQYIPEWAQDRKSLHVIRKIKKNSKTHRNRKHITIKEPKTF